MIPLMRRAFERGAHAAAARAAEVHVAAEHRSDGQRSGDDYRFVIEAFVFVKAFGIGDVDGKIVEVRLRNRRADFFGPADPRECEYYPSTNAGE